MTKSVAFMRHREIHDGQHHENECLQYNDQYVEDRPAGAEDRAENRANQPGSSPEAQQEEDDFPGVHVAVEP